MFLILFSYLPILEEKTYQTNLKLINQLTCIRTPLFAIFLKSTTLTELLLKNRLRVLNFRFLYFVLIKFLLLRILPVFRLFNWSQHSLSYQILRRKVLLHFLLHSWRNNFYSWFHKIITFSLKHLIFNLIYCFFLHLNFLMYLHYFYIVFIKLSIL